MIGFDTQDWVLDVVGAGTPGTDSWNVEFKDDDELDHLVQIGATTPGEAERIREQGRHLHAAFSAARWPFDAEWEQWLPSENEGPTSLPEGWRDLESRCR